MERHKISYLEYEEIDTDKWDNCLANAPNSLVYAQSWYLDKLCETWGALVLGDYQYVMPVTYKRKFGVSYLYQPIYCQQLGVFPPPTPEINNLFFEELMRRFPFAEISLNAMHLPPDGMKKKESRHNYLLSLSDSYDVLSTRYSNHTKRKLKKAEGNKLNYISDVPIKAYLQFKKENLVTKVGKQTLMHLHNIMAFAISRNLGQVFGVYSPDNSLCAAAFFIRHKKRVTYLNAVSNKQGKDLGATYILIDRFIREHAGKDYVIDFEGSMIPGVARQYVGFGATPETYYHVGWNNLPAYIKWLKK